MTNVTILGMGLMGSGMARRLLDQGLAVTVWNRNAARAEPLWDAGATVAPSPAEAVGEADIVIAMLADDDASRDVWLGGGGALGAMRTGAVAIECSTLTHDWVLALAAAARARDVALLDAPVTGSRAQAAAGALRFLAGGDRDALDRVQPVLAMLGVETVYLGPTGSGAMLKLINNFLCGVQVAALAEAVAAIERSDLDRDTAFRMIRTGAPGSPLVNAVGDRMLQRAYDPQFLIPLMAKDLDYARSTFAGLGIETRIAEAARQLFQDAAAQGYAQQDIAAVIEPLR